MAEKGVYMERLLQTISASSHVVISRRVHWYQRALRDRQAPITGVHSNQDQILCVKLGLYMGF